MAIQGTVTMDKLAEAKSFKKERSGPVGLPILQFFKHYSTSFPAWAGLAEDIFMLSPSSAAVERVFSVLRDKFDSKTLKAPIDYIAASLINARDILP